MHLMPSCKSRTNEKDSATVERARAAPSGNGGGSSLLFASSLSQKAQRDPYFTSYYS